MTHDEPHSRFIFYCTAPVLVIFLVAMPFLVRPPATTGWIAVVACELLAVCVLLGLYDAFRFWWSWRAAGGIVFTAYVAYLVHCLISGQFFAGGGRSAVSALNAVVGLVVFGIPGLSVALFGRLTLWPSRDDSLIDEFNTDCDSEDDG